MNDEKGITLTSLIIYILGMVIVVTAIATLTSYFYKNIDVNSVKNSSISQFTELTNVFVTETGKTGNKIIETALIKGDNKYKTKTEIDNQIATELQNISNNSNTDITSYIIFSSGNQYTFKNNAIYKNKVRICKDIEFCSFSTDINNSQYKITVNFKTSDIDKTGANAITYTINM